ncbi:hypothetical protein D3C71_966440 [compost metagenome]
MPPAVVLEVMPGSIALTVQAWPVEASRALTSTNPLSPAGRVKVSVKATRGIADGPWLRYWMR